MKIKWDDKKKVWEKLPKYSKEGFYLDERLKTKLDNIKSIIKKNWDAVIIIDGVERGGKSTLGITCGYYLTDTKLSIDNICTGSGEETVYKLENLPDKSLIIIDEGSLAFASVDTMKRETKRLHKILNVVGQKNLVLIIIAPSFFNLTKYIAIDRSRFLLHCYTDKQLNRGRFAYFGTDKKRMLYEIGKKYYNSYRKPRANFIGRFTNFNPLEKEYLELKKKSLKEALRDNSGEVSQTSKISVFQEIIKQNAKNEKKLTLKELAGLFGVHERTLGRYKAKSLGK